MNNDEVALPRAIKPTQLAYWYFRLNGFLITENFLLHGGSENKYEVRTDADILGVRFPYRSELDFEDDTPFLQQSHKPLVIICEIKDSQCALNGPWTKPERENMQYVLRAIGCFRPESIDNIAAALYSPSAEHEDANAKVQLLVAGATENQQYRDERPALTQLLFPNMATFIYKRFRTYRKHKKEHQGWDNAGHFLFRQSCKLDEVSFVRRVLAEL